MLDPYTISVDHFTLDLEIDPDSAPTKSLSSLAGSNSEDDEPKNQGLESDFSSFFIHTPHLLNIKTMLMNDVKDTTVPFLG